MRTVAVGVVHVARRNVAGLQDLRQLVQLVVLVLRLLAGVVDLRAIPVGVVTVAGVLTRAVGLLLQPAQLVVQLRAVGRDAAGALDHLALFGVLRVVEGRDRLIGTGVAFGGAA